MHEAKTNLSQYVEVINESKSIIICKNGCPSTSNLYPGSTKKRRLGAWQGQVWMANDFNHLPDSFMHYFN